MLGTIVAIAVVIGIIALVGLAIRALVKRTENQYDPTINTTDTDYDYVGYEDEDSVNLPSYAPVPDANSPPVTDEDDEDEPAYIPVPLDPIPYEPTPDVELPGGTPESQPENFGGGDDYAGGGAGGDIASEPAEPSYEPAPSYEPSTPSVDTGSTSQSDSGYGGSGGYGDSGSSSSSSFDSGSSGGDSGGGGSND